MAKEGQRSGGACPRGTPTLVVRSIEPQLSACQVVQFPSRKLRNHVPPQGNSSRADPQGSGNVGLAPEMSHGGVFSHGDKLSMPSNEMQPYLAPQQLSLVSMSSQAWKRCETLADRLQWAIDHAGISQADLSDHLKISSAAMSEWFTGKVKNPKLRNIRRAAQFCKVHSWWLAIGEGSPYDGIDTEFDGISGQDLIIAKGLSDLADNGLRGTVEELIAARRNAQEEEKVQKKRKA